jgi:ATP-dependent Clp protease adaptor protein ClpS
MRSTLASAQVEVERPDEADQIEHDRPWVVIVWNDPINLMSYVTFVLQKLFGYGRQKAIG